MSASKESESTPPDDEEIIPEWVTLEAGDKDDVMDRTSKKLQPGVGEKAVFRIKGRVAVMSNLVKNLISGGAGAADEGAEDDLGDEADLPDAAGGAKEITIPLPNVKSSILRKVIDFCEHYCVAGQEMPEIAMPLKSGNLRDYIPEWYVNYVNQILATNQETLFNLILAANFLDIEPLLDLTCAKVASTVMNVAGAAAAAAAGGPTLVDEAYATVMVSDPENSQFGQPTLPPICECGGVRAGTTCYCARPKRVFQQIRESFGIPDDFTKKDVADDEGDNAWLEDVLP